MKSKPALIALFTMTLASVAHADFGDVGALCGEGDDLATKWCDITALPILLPIVIFHHDQVDLRSSEAITRFQAEAKGDADPVITNALADKFQVSAEQVKATALALMSNGEEATPAAVAQMLQ